MSNGDGPQTLRDWIDYLHTAAQVKPGHPDYPEARDAVMHALLHINALHVGAGQQEATEAEQVGAVPAGLAALAHGASLGTGEVISGVGSATTGGSFREGAQQYREGLENIEASQPNLAATAELAGGLAVPGAAVGKQLTGAVRAGVPLGVRAVTGLLGRSALAAGVPGAVAGFSAGGADPGDLAARGSQALKTGLISAGLGAATAGAGIPLARAHVERAADLASKGVLRDLRAQRLRNAIAAGIRREPAAPVAAEPAIGGLAGPAEAAGGFEASSATQAAVADIAAAQQDFLAGKISAEDYETAVRFARGELPAEAGPPAVAPIPGTQGRGLTAEGPPTPAAPTAPTAAEMVTGRSNAPVQLPGGGQVLPAATGVAPSAAELAQRAQPTTAPWRRPPVGPIRGIPPLAPAERPMTLADLGTGQTVPYYPRGGQVEQALPPPPGGPSGLGGPARSVAQIADEMEAQIDLAARLGQEPNVQNLPSLLQRRGLTPQQIQAVGKELLRRSLRRKAG